MNPPYENVPASAVHCGDRVTETTTPAGPWYRVTAVDRVRRVLTVDDGAGLLVEVPAPSGTDRVLRRVDRVPPGADIGE